MMAKTIKEIENFMDWIIGRTKKEEPKKDEKPADRKLEDEEGKDEKEPPIILKR